VNTADMFKRADDVRKRQQFIMGMLPENPPRDSLEFWYKVLHEYTGVKVTDSGLFYGYGYEQPLRSIPIIVQIRDSQLEMVSISTAHFLHTNLDPSTEKALEIQEMLNKRGAESEVSWDEIIHRLGFPKGDYTYNLHTDLSQDFAYDIDAELVIVRTHNGADSRWGFSHPVVAEFKQQDYFWYWWVGWNCSECSALWEQTNFYGKDLGGLYDIPLVLKERETYDPDQESDLLKFYEVPEDGTYDIDSLDFYCPECGSYHVYGYVPGM
jgi:hypothetical protein